MEYNHFKMEGLCLLKDLLWQSNYHLKDTYFSVHFPWKQKVAQFIHLRISPASELCKWKYSFLWISHEQVINGSQDSIGAHTPGEEAYCKKKKCTANWGKLVLKIGEP